MLTFLGNESGLASDIVSKFPGCSLDQMLNLAFVPSVTEDRKSRGTCHGEIQEGLEKAGEWLDLGGRTRCLESPDVERERLEVKKQFGQLKTWGNHYLKETLRDQQYLFP